MTFGKNIDDLLSGMEPKPVDLPSTSNASHVILVWAFRKDHPHQLVAVTTNAKDADRYESVAREMYPGCVASSEIVPLDHAYGRGMLRELNRIKGEA